MADTTSWNDPCPCGSGDVYKTCCGRELLWEKRQKRNRIIVILAIVVAAIGLLAYLQRDIEQAKTATPTKEGFVWSFEHNHFHELDDDGNVIPE